MCFMSKSQGCVDVFFGTLSPATRSSLGPSAVEFLSLDSSTDFVSTD